MRIFLFLSMTAFCSLLQAQPALKTGDLFPSMIIRNIINAPLKQYDVQAQNKKLLILNFWGTWCSPCLPEMDSLARLQGRNRAAIQVIGISDEPADRLQKYLQRKPSTLWLASDTGMYLYRQFGFSYVGQAAVIDRFNRIVALVRTDSVNQTLIDRLLQGRPVTGSAETGRGQTASDPFNADSTLGFQLTWSSYRASLSSMRKTYLKTSLEGRRVTYCNICISSMYQDAYGLSNKQVVYEVPEKTVCDWDNKSTLYCLDLLVKPAQKDSLQIILRQTLNNLTPLKARPEKRMMPVYVLLRLPGATAWEPSAAGESTFSYSGRGFEGKGIAMPSFVDYVSNELELPVVDETGLTGRYDIQTENVLRTRQDMLAALQKLGLKVEKKDREMEVIVIHQ